MSISSDFVPAEEAAQLLEVCVVEKDQEFMAMRVRHLRRPTGEQLVLVEGGLGEYAVMSC